MPSNGDALNGDGVSLLVGQAVDGRLAWRIGNLTRPKLLDSLGGGVGRVVWQVEEHLFAMGFLLLRPSTKVVQGRTLKIGLGIVHCLLEEVNQLALLVASIEEAMEEEVEFLHDVLHIQAKQMDAEDISEN